MPDPKPSRADHGHIIVAYLASCRSFHKPARRTEATLASAVIVNHGGPEEWRARPTYGMWARNSLESEKGDENVGSIGWTTKKGQHDSQKC